LWDKRAGVMQVTDTTQNTVEVRLVVSAENSAKAFNLRCYIRENIVTFIQDNFPESLPKTRAIIETKNQADLLPPANKL